MIASSRRNPRHTAFAGSNDQITFIFAFHSREGTPATGAHRPRDPARLWSLVVTNHRGIHAGIRSATNACVRQDLAPAGRARNQHSHHAASFARFMAASGSLLHLSYKTHTCVCTHTWSDQTGYTSAVINAHARVILICVNCVLF